MFGLELPTIRTNLENKMYIHDIQINTKLFITVIHIYLLRCGMVVVMHKLLSEGEKRFEKINKGRQSYFIRIFEKFTYYLYAVTQRKLLVLSESKRFLSIFSRIFF